MVPLQQNAFNTDRCSARFMGKGVSKAVDNVINVIGPALKVGPGYLDRALILH
jgi:enolase